jgi:hypothetical protein
MNHTLAHRLSIIVAAVAACAAAASGPFHRGAGQPPAYLYFTNESLDQADVFAATPGGLPVRIGTVFAGRTDTLKVRADIASNGQNINIVARLLARSARPSRGPIPIRPGDRLVVRLPSDQKLLVVLPGQ